MARARVRLCPRCGQKLPESGEFTALLKCEFCGEQIHITGSSSRIFRLPDEIQLQTPAFGVERSPWLDMGLQEAPSPQAALDSKAASDDIPAAPKTVPKDLDKAITSYALGLFRVNGWPCMELEGYRAFIVKAAFRDSKTGNKDVANITVSASGGVLTFETVVLPLPAPPWNVLREAINALNLCCGGAVFVLRECGIAARNRLLPGGGDVASFTVEDIMQSLRQLNHDRKLALPILEEAVRDARLSPTSIELTFSGPLLPNVVPTGFDQLYDLCQSSGYHAVRDGDMIGLSTTPCPFNQCLVQASSVGGVVRLWTVLGEDVEALMASDRWQYVRQVLRTLSRESPALTPTQLNQLLERLNSLNDTSGLIRYVWSNGKVYAMAVVPASGKELAVEDLQCFAQALFRCAHQETPRREWIRRAV